MARPPLDASTLPLRRVYRPSNHGPSAFEGSMAAEEVSGRTLGTNRAAEKQLGELPLKHQPHQLQAQSSPRALGRAGFAPMKLSLIHI